MRAVFPCKGVIVLTKKDIQALEKFYQNTMLKSNMLEVYKTTEHSVQIGNFNYLPPKAKVIVDKSHLLTIKQLNAVINGKPIPKEEPAIQQEQQEEKQFSDDDILSNPFFQTLKPLD